MVTRRLRHAFAVVTLSAAAVGVAVLLTLFPSHFEDVDDE